MSTEAPRGTFSEAGWALLAVLGARLALWLVYLQARHFLVFLLPGYPTQDLLCLGGPCGLDVLRQVGPALAISTAALVLIHLAVEVWAGRDVARLTTLLACAAPGSLELLLAPGGAFVALGIAIALFAASRGAWPTASVSLGAVCLVGPLPLLPGVVVLATVVVIALESPGAQLATVGRWVAGGRGAPTARGRAALLLLPVVAGVLARRVLPQLELSATPLTGTPGQLEVSGVELGQVLLALPLVGVGASALLAPRRLPIAALCLGVVFGGLAFAAPAASRAIALVPVIWLLPALGLSRRPGLEAALGFALAALQGALTYHVAHQVPVL